MNAYTCTCSLAGRVKSARLLLHNVYQGTHLCLFYTQAANPDAGRATLFFLPLSSLNPLLSQSLD